MITCFNAAAVAGMLLPSALCINYLCIVSGFTPSSHLPAIGPVKNKGGVSNGSMRLQVVEELASVLDTVDCKATTYSAPNEDNDDGEDVIVNGTPERVQQNPLGKIADAISLSVFSALHYDDNLGIKDSSKNLRVLWSRAYLDCVGKMDNPIAYQLLPPRTRDVVKVLPRSGPLVAFQEFITTRTEFTDGAVDCFLHGVDETTTFANKGVCRRPQIVLFGVGYNTRSLRYNNRADFFAVDLPDVVEGKNRLQHYWKDLEDKKIENKEGVILLMLLGYDLNDAAISEKVRTWANRKAATCFERFAGDILVSKIVYESCR